MRPEHAAPRRRWGTAAVGALVGAVGLALLATPWSTPHDGRPWVLAATGVALAATSAAMLLGSLARPRPDRAVTSRRGTAGTVLTVRLRTEVPWSVALVGTGFTVFFVAAALALGAAGLLIAPFALFFASLVPDAVMSLVRPRALRLDAVGVRLEGWGVSAALAWDDVAEVAMVTPGRRPSLEVRGVDGASSWRHRRQRLVWPTEPASHGPVLTVPLASLDAPGAVFVLCRELAAGPRARREAVLEHDAVGLLTNDRSR